MWHCRRLRANDSEVWGLVCSASSKFFSHPSLNRPWLFRLQKNSRPQMSIDIHIHFNSPSEYWHGISIASHLAVDLRCQRQEAKKTTKFLETWISWKDENTIFFPSTQKKKCYIVFAPHSHFFCISLKILWKMSAMKGKVALFFAGRSGKRLNLNGSKNHWRVSFQRLSPFMAMTIFHCLKEG